MFSRIWKASKEAIKRFFARWAGGREKQENENAKSVYKDASGTIIDGVIVFYKNPLLEGGPFYERNDIKTDEDAKAFLCLIIEYARKSERKVAQAARGEWKNNPPAIVRAAFGHWYVSAMRHLEAMNILSAVRDYSVVTLVHHRQIFEIYIQVRFFASLNPEQQESYGQKIHAIGSVEYIEKLKVVKDHPFIKPNYDEMIGFIDDYDPGIIEEIYKDRKKGQYRWFGRTYTSLAKEVSKDGDKLDDLYRILATSAHGSWDLALGVDYSKPGTLNFRGYSDKRTMYLRAAEEIDQATKHFLNLWNEVAESVGALKVMYTCDEIPGESLDA